jgi:hypothetical protein
VERVVADGVRRVPGEVEHPVVDEVRPDRDEERAADPLHVREEGPHLADHRLAGEGEGEVSPTRTVLIPSP